MNKLISVIIPTYNRKETLKETLLSFKSQKSEDFELIVADDGSTDGTGEMIESLQLPCPIKHVWQKNSGRSAARNMGIQIAGGEIILFIDDHIIVNENLIAEHIKSHKNKETDKIAVVRGRVEFFDTIDKTPKPDSPVSSRKIKISISDQDPFRNFITNNISVDKKALIEVGGFDEDFKEYGLQDSELGYRLRKAGYKFQKNPNAVGYIFGVGLTFEKRCSRRRQVGRSSVLFYKKHPNLKIKLSLSAHLLTRLIYRIYSVFEKMLKSKKALFFHSFLKGVNEGFEKYKDKKYSRMNSRLRKKRILMVSHSARLEGAPISLFLLAKNINKDKLDVTFAFPGSGPLKSKLAEEEIKSVKLIGPSILFAHQVKKIISNKGIDLIHVNTLASLWAVNGAKKTGIPIVWHIREAPENHQFINLKKETEKVNKIIAISNWVKSAFNLDKNKTEVVPNGVDLGKFNKNIKGEKTRRALGIKENDIAVVKIGAISKRKGSDIFIKAAKLVLEKNKNIKFILVGEYTPGELYKNKFKVLLKQLGLENKIIFTGIRKDIPEIIAASDIIVNSSRSEPSGRTILEAMAMQKPVVGANVGGIPEIIINNKTGILANSEDSESFAGAIKKLLDDRNLRSSMGIAGRKRIEEHFSIQKHARQIESIYDKVLSK